jgi:3-deoxy-D-manno-octulosonic-acid transferase
VNKHCAIAFYNAINLLLLPLYILLLFVRIIKAKDNWISFKQRLGFACKQRLAGKLLWIHAASVGESMVAITLIRALSTLYPKYNFLVTTGTLSSAQILEKSLPQNASHQFTPIDNFLVVRKFLNHWKPDLGIFIESELWPCLITQAASKCNMILVNARLSDKSYKRWKSNQWLFKLIIDNFKKVIVQSKSDLYKYQQLGCSDPINLGNLKFANKELEIDQQTFLSLKNLFGNKKIFVAASTHKEDEDVTLQVITEFKQTKIDYFPIIVLRHPERRDELAAQCNKLGLKFSIRSSQTLPSLDDDLFIVDSFGELGLFYSLAFIVFVGGSFKRGGHNLVEPAYFDNIILLGPDMSNFQNIADEMIEKQAAFQVQTGNELAVKIKFFLDTNNTKESAKYRKNALEFVSDRKKTLSNYLKEIGRFSQ